MAKDNTEKKTNSCVCRKIKTVAVRTCCIFTVLIISVYTFTVFILSKSVIKTGLANTTALFAIALTAAIVSLLYDSDTVSFWIAHNSVFVSAGIPYYIFLIIKSKSAVNSKDGILIGIGTVIFIAAFAILTPFIYKANKNKKKDNEKKYVSRF